ncbi:MAG: DUF2156 domain-containing protein [Clostridia bacterium]|nr:DUF2156 domain-containing protein [Clostridia bacterium]
MVFRKVVPKDKELFDKYKSKTSKYSENSFVTLYLWDKYYNLHLCEEGGFLFIRFTIDGKNQYLFPMGEGDVKKAFQKVMDEEEKITLRFVTDVQKEFIEQNFPNEFSFTLREDLCDYVYETQRLMTFSGKKLHGKKNHVNYFEKTYAYTYETVTNEVAQKECRELLLRWVDDKTKNLNPIEHDAMEKVFDNFELFNLIGGVIRIEGEIVAMTFGERLTEDTVLVQIEKAREEIRGAYPMICKKFLENEWADTTFVNREEDMGLEGLRKAKESYCPIFKTLKYQGKRI